MGQVHQVVDHQAVIALDVKQPAAVRPLVTHCPLQVMYQRRVGKGLIAGPYPDKAIAFNRGKGLVARKTTHPLPGHFDGLTVSPHDQAVIAAYQVAIFDITQ